MKKIILAVTLLALAGSQVQTAKAHGFPIAAGVVGGLVAGTVVAQAVAPPVYYAPAPAYYQPAPVVYASPAVVYPQPVYVTAPVVSVGFGFGRPGYYCGYYHSYYSHPYFRGHR